MTAELLTRASSAWQDLAAQTGPLWNEWRRLWDSLDADERDPATHPAWQSAWLALHRDSVRDIRVAVCRTADELLALIPLEVVSAGAGRRSRCTLVVPDEVPLEGASLAVRRDDLPRVLDALLRTPVDRRTASMIEFARVDATHSLVTQQGLTCRVEAAGTRSVIDLPANPADLWAALGSNLCGNLRKARNKWNKLPGARIDALTSEQQLASALARLADVESRSWKAEHGTDLASDAAIRQFFAGTLPLLASEGRAVSHVLVADGRDIGAHLALQIGNELLVHKIAFDADYKDCAPGNLLLQHLLDDYAPHTGITRINLVTSLPWHERWKPRQSATCRVQVFPRGLNGLWSRAWSIPPRRRMRHWLHRTGFLNRIRAWRKRLPES